MEQDYFDSFMNEVERDLKKTGKSFVFLEEQVKYLKNKYKKMEIIDDNGIYYINLKDMVDNNKEK